jgi:hypothetical protein
MDRFDAVILDWSGTLVHDPPLRDRVASTYARPGRPDTGEIDEVCAALERCWHHWQPSVPADSQSRQPSLAGIRSPTLSGVIRAAESGMRVLHEHVLSSS